MQIYYIHYLKQVNTNLISYNPKTNLSMKKKQFETLEIEFTQNDKYPLPYHSHTYYEIIYVVSGFGSYKVNDITMPYEPEDLLLISPEDMHQFFFDINTSLLFIKFTEHYFHSNMFFNQTSSAYKTVSDIMRSTLFKEEKPSLNYENKILLQQTMKNISSYSGKEKPSSSSFLYFQILSVIGLIEETSKHTKSIINKGLTNKQDLITYIHQNIFNPKKIKIKPITNHFHISANYFSHYFKRNFNISFRQYINEYRMKLIENRLSSGKYTISEIAEEFGFSDASHFTNYFKAQKNITPKTYRKNVYTTDKSL